MKITRYFQSCLLIENNGRRILIDPSKDDEQTVYRLGELDAVFYTHEHTDHFDAQMAQIFVEQGIAPVYANDSTAKHIQASKSVVENGKSYEVGGFKIKAIELPHCLLPDGSQGPQNTGYLVNDRFFHPGDGKELKDLSVDTLALPITGPDVSMKDCFFFAKQVSAKYVIPIHYDKLGANPEIYKSFASRFTIFNFKFHNLSHGQSVEV